MGEVLTVLPFQNTLSTVQAKGSTILAALENGLSKIEEGSGRFPQVAGLTFVYDPAAQPGSRVVSVKVMTDGAWSGLQPDRIYGVVTNNFVRRGGDGYAMFGSEGMNAYDFGPDLADVTAEYLGRMSPYMPYVDGRISVK
jgi:5'-nucleotidase